ncbi:hypothetical protein BSP109_03286 [Brevibacterium sp. Mu109]|uniref:hypothetical protein n=1 Tax=Brevibacterium sp. Mu109 TaxID=1255669 RepID=UPI000C373CAF|nr:hypothetical protein [Brevibacterium sp. Mu109]SMY01515.1 hypothetical protein BSP109_03286 [Brevibacterium sp. Mu109]
MAQNSDILAGQIAALKRKQRAQEKKEFEAFGREVADLLAPGVAGTTARIKTARAKLPVSDGADHGDADPVAHGDDDTAAPDDGDSVGHGFGEDVAHARQHHSGGARS